MGINVALKLGKIGRRTILNVAECCFKKIDRFLGNIKVACNVIGAEALAKLINAPILAAKIKNNGLIILNVKGGLAFECGCCNLIAHIGLIVVLTAAL